jgi:hypothetical protein
VAYFQSIPNDRISAQDIEALYKVTTTLYVRDQSISLFHGNESSLSSSGYTSAVLLKGKESIDCSKETPARLALARIQEQIRVSLYSKEGRGGNMPTIALIAALNDKLCQWADANSKILSEDITSARGLHITYCSTRIMLLRLSATPDHRIQALQESRVCFQLLAKPTTRLRPCVKSIPLL